MNAQLKDRLEQVARLNHEKDVADGRVITFSVCRVCGFVSWVSSGPPGEGFSVLTCVYVHAFDRACRRCEIALQRAPEVCAWVMGVFAHSEMMRQSDESRKP